ncbi:hypothetical protein D5018_17670 [Parashewanella curva]|uniref:Phosphatidylinositol kinase n=2 Tax=Parashewanella curva TaxID=2338552 RepID=A0A3L8PSL2_9GAMM|nr:hypothetical protein D5018_17670 [Parashewanella curva]
MKYEVKKIKVDPVDLEQLGTKEKFWFRFKEHDSKWLFKYSRKDTGEHWSEKVAEQLCKSLGIPHVIYYMAEMNGRSGVVSPNIISPHSRMVMGNEVLHNETPNSYPEPLINSQKQVRVKEHTVTRVLACLDNGVLPPKTWQKNQLNSGDIFCGYLMLDALISNQDRHHENWAIVVDMTSSEKYLCETYDHAASLGRELKDEERKERLLTKDKNRMVATFVTKARSEIFRFKKDKKPLFTLDAFFEAVSERPSAKKYWISKLKELTDSKINDIFNAIPDDVISSEAREFALQMVIENKKRLLTDERV